MKFTTKNGKLVLEEDNVLKNEERYPCQISVCENEVLIREFVDYNCSSNIVV